MDVDGNNQTRIHNSTSNDGDPHFRFDGNKIVFNRFTQAMPPTGDIYVIDPDGNNLTNLTSDIQTEVSRPKWSWDGTKIIYCASVGIDDKDIYMMNADGTNKTALITGSNNDEWPSYSPNGQYIVFQRYIGSIQNQKSKICRYKISDGTITELTDGNNLDEMPVYSPDGNYLLFKRGTANPEIYQLRIDNSSLTNLTNNSVADDAPMYSYDGTKIAWMQSSTGMNSAEIWIMNSDGTNKTQLTSNSVADFNPSFAPFTQATGPEINIKGNDQDIQSGDATPSTSNYTDFGSTLVDGGSVTRTFTTENKGNQNLTLSGNPIVQITGTNSADFSVLSNPLATIAAGSSTTFQITFDPGSSGVRSATVSIANNDADENPYLFSIQGTGSIPALPVYNKIAFTRSQSSSDWDIWIMERDGTNEKKITENIYRDTNPHFNPFGTRIVFARLFSQQPIQSDIIAIDPDGRNEINLTDISSITQAALSPKYSWDGQYITFDVTAGIGNGDIWMMNADGTGHHAVLNSTSGDDSSPAFSPDGQWIVFQRLITTQPEPKCKICKVKISDGTVVDLTDGNYNDETPVFSADGNYILFKRGYTEWDLFRMPSDHNPSDNTTLLNMTNQPTTPDGTASYSYEGDKIVYYTAVMAPETAEIYIMNSDGSNNTRITNNSVADWDPTFSPALQSGTEINIKGNDQTIQNGDATPRTSDYTDFGSTSVGVGSLTRTFTIENSGNQNLTLSGNPIVQITGTNSTDFSVLSNPSTTISTGGSTTFQITFDPGSSGIRSAIVSIANNDADENPYTFTIQGTGTAAANAMYDKIAFTRQESTNDWDIWIMDSDGNNQYCLLNSSEKDMNPHFSPDGKYIAFSRSSGTAPNLINDVYIMNSDGTNVKNLTDDVSDGCVGPKFSWDGSKIVFFRNVMGTGNVICTMNLDGSNKQYVNDQTGSPVVGDSPFFTPDGQWLVFQRVDPDKLEGAVYKVPVAGGSVIQLTNATDFDELPRVSADGQFVISKFDPLRNGISDIAKFSINQTPQTSAVSNLSNTPADWEDAPMYSYEGNKIVFMATSGGTYNSMEIFVMNSDGTNRTRLTNNSQQDFDPTFSPASQINVPSSPVASAASSITQTSFTANWNAVTEVIGYYLDVSTDNNFTNFVPGYNNKVVGDIISYVVDANLLANTVYHYRVKAYNESGTSGNSNTITLTTLPNAPNAPTAAAATLILQTSFTANWNAVVGATGYYLDVSTENNFSSFVTGYNNKDVSNVISFIVDTNLTIGTAYHYRVRSYNAGGISANSNTITLTTLPNIPAAPIALAATLILQTSFTANWNAVVGATGYYLDVSTENSFTSFVTGYNNKDIGNVISFIVDTNLTIGTAYHYRVRSYNAGGTSNNSNTISITLVGIDNYTNLPTEYELKQNFPNPFNPSTTIKYALPFDSKVLIKIYNILGQEVALLKDEIIFARNYEIQFNSSNLPSGVYFYRLSAESLNGKQKFSSIKKMIILK
jgi:Tol biopolymer transport system component